ncbi:hypothetical protein JCM3766R1_002718 [Sporobolomyces carnicolor]
MAGLSTVERAKALLEQRRKSRTTSEPSDKGDSGHADKGDSDAKPTFELGEDTVKALLDQKEAMKEWETATKSSESPPSLRPPVDTTRPIPALDTASQPPIGPQPAAFRAARAPELKSTPSQPLSWVPYQPQPKKPALAPAMPTFAAPVIPTFVPAQVAMHPDRYDGRLAPQNFDPRSPERRMSGYTMMTPTMQPWLPSSGFAGAVSLDRHIRRSSYDSYPSAGFASAQLNYLSPPFTPAHATDVKDPSMWSPAPPHKPVTLARPSLRSLREAASATPQEPSIATPEEPPIATPADSSSDPRPKQSSSSSESHQKDESSESSSSTSSCRKTEPSTSPSTATPLGKAEPPKTQQADPRTENGEIACGESSSLDPKNLSLDLARDDPSFAMVYALLHSTLRENVQLSLELEEKAKRIGELSSSSSANDQESLLSEAVNTIVRLEDDLETCFAEISRLRSLTRDTALVESSIQTDEIVESDKARIEAEVESLSRELELARERIKAHEAKIRSMESRVLGLEHTLDESEKRARATQTRLDDALAKNQKHAERSQDLIVKLQERQHEVFGMRARAKSAEQTLKALKMRENEVKDRFFKLEIHHKQEASLCLSIGPISMSTDRSAHQVQQLEAKLAIGEQARREVESRFKVLEQETKEVETKEDASEQD